MSFAPKSGCPMCGIVSSAVHSQINHRSFCADTNPFNSGGADILWRDDNFTVYREKSNPVSSKAHIIIAFNLHVPSIYSLSSTDLPLLTSIKDLGKRLLAQYSSSTLQSPTPSPFAYMTSQSSPSLTPTTTSADNSTFRIGFITPPFRDSKIPVTGHLHAHAYITPSDLLGWWRGIAYSPMAWYDIDDLIAEIRESTSNNRIRSAAARARPIDEVPGACARSGHADGREITEVGLNTENSNLEDGLHNATPLTSPTSPKSPTALPPSRSFSSSSLVSQSQIPAVSLRV